MNTVHVHFGEENSMFIRQIASKLNISNSECAERLMSIISSAQIDFSIVINLPIEKIKQTQPKIIKSISSIKRL